MISLLSNTACLCQGITFRYFTKRIVVGLKIISAKKLKKQQQLDSPYHCSRWEFGTIFKAHMGPYHLGHLLIWRLNLTIFENHWSLNSIEGWATRALTCKQGIHLSFHVLFWTYVGVPETFESFFTTAITKDWLFISKQDIAVITNIQYIQYLDAGLHQNWAYTIRYWEFLFFFQPTWR